MVNFTMGKRNVEYMCRFTHANLRGEITVYIFRSSNYKHKDTQTFNISNYGGVETEETVKNFLVKNYPNVRTF